MTGAPGGAEEPVPSSRNGRQLLELIRVQARLRGPGGCPWDAEQTHRSLAPHLLEETHEMIGAIEADDSDAMREELGDLLLQVTFHAQIAADDGRWDIDDVAEGLVAKLVHRHPHVFGDVEVSGADEVLANWEKLKFEEHGPRELEEDVPSSLPALARASKVQRRAEARDLPTPELPAAAEEVAARVAALQQDRWDDPEAEIGDVLFALVGIARSLGVDPEGALRASVRRFAERAEAPEEEAEDEEAEDEEVETE